LEKQKLNKLLKDLICDPRNIDIQSYPKNYFAGTMLNLVVKSNGYYWNIFNKQRLFLIENILKNGADPNQQCSDGNSLIYHSLNSYMLEGLEITKLLLEYGANPDGILINKVNNNYKDELLLLLLKYDYVIVEIFDIFDIF